MKTRTSILLILVAALFLPTAALASNMDLPGTPDQKRVLIRELLDTTGSINLGKQMMARMVDAMKVGKSAEEQKRMDQLASRMDASELMDQIIDIYDHHFTTEEISSVLEFYKSPAGRKFISEMPSLMQEGMDIGAKWGEKKQQEFVNELQSDRKSD